LITAEISGLSVKYSLESRKSTSYENKFAKSNH